MNIVLYPKREEWAGLLERPCREDESLEKCCGLICEEVRRDGDAALRKYAWFFDRARIDAVEVTVEEKRAAELAAYDCDFFLASTNAITEDGVMVNVDGYANRVSAIAAGPRTVLMIVGMNKVVKHVEDAFSRARNEAAPINAQRFGVDTPCSKNGMCYDCKSPDTICCQILITRFSKIPGRIKVILVNDELGF